MKDYRIGRLEVRLADYFEHRALHKAIAQQPEVREVHHEPVTLEQGAAGKGVAAGTQRH